MTQEGISPDGYISGATVHNYLSELARDHIRRTRLETTVVAMHKRHDGGWTI